MQLAASQRRRRRRLLAMTARQPLERADDAHRHANRADVAQRRLASRAHLKVIEVVLVPAERAERQLAEAALDAVERLVLERDLKVVRLLVEALRRRVSGS